VGIKLGTGDGCGEGGNVGSCVGGGDGTGVGEGVGTCVGNDETVGFGVGTPPKSPPITVSLPRFAHTLAKPPASPVIKASSKGASGKLPLSLAEIDDASS
jgi:hypothetical protein